MPGPGLRCASPLFALCRGLARRLRQHGHALDRVRHARAERVLHSALHWALGLAAAALRRRSSIAPNIAVTNDHNLNLLSPRHGAGTLAGLRPSVLPHRARAAPLQITSPQVGQTVIAYGQDGQSRRREAQRHRARARCARSCASATDCPEQPTITFDAEAGEGFSGGPVVDATIGCRGRDHLRLSRRRGRRWRPAHVCHGHRLRDGRNAPLLGTELEIAGSGRVISDA